MNLMMLIWFLASMLTSCFFFGNGEVLNFDLFIEEANFTRLCSTKRMLTSNGSFPGPAIIVHKGDTAYINVHNQGTYGITMHWHGVRQPRNPWFDGPENITQCPIPAGTNFTYEVIFSTEEGTLWYHAHSQWTRATVHGPIVVLPANGTTYPFATPDSQETIVIASWYKSDVMAIYGEGIATGTGFNVSDAYTINGQPGDLYDCSNETRYHFTVEYGKTYLLRLINAALNEEHFFAIADHNLTVVGQDGAYIKPIATNYVVITPGQTLDILVTTNQTPSYYYMAATPFFDSSVAFDNTTTTSILQYSEANYTSSIPFPSFPSYDYDKAASNFTSLIRSLASKEHPINVPLNINKRLYITLAVNKLPCNSDTCENEYKLAASLNNISFVAPDIDILSAYYSNLSGIFEADFPFWPPNYYNFTGDVTNITDVTTAGTKVAMLDYGDAIEIVFQGTNIDAAENHPAHLHGFSFYLVGTGSGNFNNHIDPNSYNLIDPPEINTVGVPKNGWAAIRFFADNPGVWFVHCHLERHLTWGMDTVIVVRNGTTRDTSIRSPPAYMPPCSSSLPVLEMITKMKKYEHPY